MMPGLLLVSRPGGTNSLPMYELFGLSVYESPLILSDPRHLSGRQPFSFFALLKKNTKTQRPKNAASKKVPASRNRRSLIRSVLVLFYSLNVI